MRLCSAINNLIASYTYDGNGNLTKTVTSAGDGTSSRTVKNMHDNRNRVIAADDGSGYYTRYEYDNMGNIPLNYANGFYLSNKPGHTLFSGTMAEELETVGINYYRTLGYSGTSDRAIFYNVTEFELVKSNNYYTENAIRIEYDNYRRNDPTYKPIGRRCVYD